MYKDEGGTGATGRPALKAGDPGINATLFEDIIALPIKGCAGAAHKVIRPC